MPIEYRTKRIYDEPSEADGERVLVDRLWPRGVSKQDAQLDLWAKEFAPSNELRKWLHEDQSRYNKFIGKYRSELEARQERISEILIEIDAPRITLLSAIKDLETGHVPALLDYLQQLES